MTARDRSYGVRDAIATALGRPLHADFSCMIDVVLEDGTVASLRHTTNAGFRGIEGWIVHRDGTRRTVSLGDITTFAAPGTTILDVRP